MHVSHQASVNSKAETCEDLQGRRKKLHVGMCSLLREDLALLADEILSSSNIMVRCWV